MITFKSLLAMILIKIGIAEGALVSSMVINLEAITR